MATGEIRVDVARLLDIAADLGLAHRTLAGSPAYTELNAGDRAGRVPDAVHDFISKNSPVFSPSFQRHWISSNPFISSSVQSVYILRKRIPI